MAASAAFATEQGHFYLTDGTPFYECPVKSRPGDMRPTTVRDALAAGAEPSVSTILKCAAAPQLTRWMIEQALDSMATLPEIPGESLDDRKARALRDSQEQGKQARERGTALHGAIERHCACLPYDEQFQPHVRNVTNALAEVGIDLTAGKPEHAFCLPGLFGGKVDWHSHNVVLDFKGVDDSKVGGRMGYPDHIRQLAAYRRGLELPEGSRLLNVFIGRGEGAALVREWTLAEETKGWREFQALMLFYRISKGFPCKLLEAA